MIFWMQKTGRTLLLALCLGMTSFSWAADGQKLGFVDLGRVYQQSKQADAVQQQLDKEFGARQAALEKMRENGLALKAALENPKLSAAEREQRLQQMLKMDQEYRLQAAQLLEEYNLRRHEEFVSFQQNVHRVIAQLARQRGYHGVLSEAVYFDAAYDLTDEIIRQLNVQ